MLKKKWLITSIVVVALFFSQSALAAKTFPDVDGTKYEWAAESIRSMVDKGVVSGYKDGTFKPGKTITKAEFVHMFHKLFPEINYSAGKSSEFVDARKHWRIKILQPYSTGIMCGRLLKVCGAIIRTINSMLSPTNR